MSRGVTHECCANARRELFAYKTARGYSWKLGNPTFVSVIYCPWCGVQLEAARLAKLREPRVALVKELLAPPAIDWAARERSVHRRRCRECRITWGGCDDTPCPVCERPGERA